MEGGLRDHICWGVEETGLNCGAVLAELSVDPTGALELELPSSSCLQSRELGLYPLPSSSHCLGAVPWRRS